MYKTNTSPSVKIVCSGFKQENFELISNKLHQISVSTQYVKLDSLSADCFDQPLKVLTLQLDKDDFVHQLSILKQIKKNQPSITLVFSAEGIELEQVQELINELSVFSILLEKDNLVEVVKKAIEASRDKNEYYKNLEKVKQQNTQLESLNQNLEQLVYERTKKEFEANQQTEISLKDMQSLLSFIKLISRSENTEELMSLLRSEFRKIHGIMPPVLVITDAKSAYRVFYFQGKQFTEKNIKDDKKNLFQSDHNTELRADLSNIFGRPYGGVTVAKFLHFIKVAGWD